MHMFVSTKAAPDTSNSPRKLYVFLHQGNPLRVYGAQLRILKQMHHEGLCGFLQRLNGLALPSELLSPRTTIQSNFSNLSIINQTRPSTTGDLKRDTHEAHKRQLQQQKLRVGLVLPDFPQCDGTRAISSSLSRGQWIAG